MTTRPRPEAVEAALTVAPVVGLLGKTAEKGMMAAGRDGERYAERVVPQIMERGGLPAQLLGDLSQGSISPMDVWHGTPYRFDRFDASKIGTGEGAQAYGHGIYTAETRPVAEEYRKVLGAKSMTIDGKPMADKITNFEIQKLVGEYSQDLPKLKQELNNYIKKFSDDNPYADISSAKNIVKAIDENKFNVGTEGYLYKIDLPDEAVANMLDWDKPLSKQPESVQSWLKDSFNPYRNQLTAKDSGGNEPTGSLIYNRLQELMSEGKKSDAFSNQANYGAANASREMMEAGVPGIRYLDQGSRVVSGGELIDIFKTPSGWKSKIKVTNRAGTGFDSPTDTFTTSMPFKTEDEARQWAQDKISGGTSNFVVFPGNEDLLRILEINDKPLGLLE
jgi:hypothetical protein